MAEITVHEPQEFVCGDDWVIAATCHNTDGSPTDLAGAALEWFLDDFNGARVLTLTVGSGITINGPPPGQPATGRATIAVTQAQSAAILPGFYRDQLRVTTADGRRSTQWMGRIAAVKAL